jgi:catechol 2,3-dioxygenase-like lactoylglutathione lyase family enzyme
MNFQGVVINVADLTRSVDFYCKVLDFEVVSREGQLAAISAPDSERAQVIVLRDLGVGRLAGAGHAGLRAVMLDVGPADRLERIAADLESRKALVNRRDHGDWTVVVGRDPDGVAVCLAWHPGGEPFSADGWRTLDDFLYGIGE